MGRRERMAIDTNNAYRDRGYSPYDIQATAQAGGSFGVSPGTSSGTYTSPRYDQPYGGTNIGYNAEVDGQRFHITDGQTIRIDTDKLTEKFSGRIRSIETRMDNLFQYKEMIQADMNMMEEEIEVPPKWCKCNRTYSSSTFPKEFVDGLDQFKVQYLVASQRLTSDELDEIKSHNRDCAHNRICALYSEHIDSPLYG
jgi:hypothetical protein